MASRNKNKKRGLESEYKFEEEEENEAPSIGEDDKFSSETSQDQDMITSSYHYFGSIQDGFSIRIIELGAGTSLPGLVAAKVGAAVTLTDNANRLEVLDNMRRVCNINDVKCRVLGLTWGILDAPVFSLHPNIILGADVLYDTRVFDDLFATVTFLLQKSPDSVFITTYHNRSGHHLIEFLMEKWGLKCTKLLDGFSFMPPHKASSLSGNIQLAEIVMEVK
ncbi:UNVERIFIED_CONTAM: Methyltransferase-like protein 23 [Sesamum calycinum]|uniref:Methyltransferase-like protein 23 n=1 Tax=Sesamum calycinum TaxID=2727403 RepID=A0AAW2SF60_9LAMI